MQLILLWHQCLIQAVNPSSAHLFMVQLQLIYITCKHTTPLTTAGVTDPNGTVVSHHEVIRLKRECLCSDLPSDAEHDLHSRPETEAGGTRRTEEVLVCSR